jgi:hypothetical protein
VIAVAVTVASIGFLAATLHGTWRELTIVAIDLRILSTTVALSVAYGLTFFILAGAWYYTLHHNSSARVPFVAAAYIYCLCNIAKYLPGSVFHFAGRQILGARLGWNHSAIARATALEIGAMAAGVCASSLIIAFTHDGSSAVSAMLKSAGLSAANWQIAAILAAAAGTGALTFVFRAGYVERLFGVRPHVVLSVVAMQTLYFSLYAIMAVIFVQQLSLTGTTLNLSWVAIAFLLSWLIGFVVPGAPGGIGVRESMLVLLLSDSGSDGAAIALVLGLGMRCVNTLGDVIGLGLAYVLRRISPSDMMISKTKASE